MARVKYVEYEEAQGKVKEAFDEQIKKKRKRNQHEKSASKRLRHL